MSAALVCPFVGDPFATHPTRKCSRQPQVNLNRSPTYLDAPHPTPTYTAGTAPHGVYDQPLAGPSSTGQWSTPHPATSVDKGKARATDHLPFHPESSGNNGE